MAKIVITDQFGNETLVASFKGLGDALVCASFLQAQLHPDTKMQYRVVFKRRSMAPDHLTHVIRASVNLSEVVEKV